MSLGLENKWHLCGGARRGRLMLNSHINPNSRAWRFWVECRDCSWLGPKSARITTVELPDGVWIAREPNVHRLVWRLDAESRTVYSTTEKVADDEIQWGLM